MKRSRLSHGAMVAPKVRLRHWLAGRKMTESGADEINIKRAIGRGTYLGALGTMGLSASAAVAASVLAPPIAPAFLAVTLGSGNLALYQKVHETLKPVEDKIRIKKKPEPDISDRK